MTGGPENGASKEPASGRLSLFGRLKRRGVLRVAIGYAMISWLLLQIADVVFDPLGVPDAMMTVLILLLAIGFPVVLLLAWFFEFTPTGIELDHLPESAERPSVQGVRRYADIAIIGVLLVVVAVLLVKQGGWVEDESLDTPVIAILPFDNIGSDSENEYFGEGMADTMIQKLGQLNELVVLASSSSFAFKGQGLDSIEIGRKLGATSVMAGSIQRAGQMLRVNTRLVDVGTGKQLWEGSYDRELRDVFAIQDEIAMAVTRALQLVLSPAREERLNAPSTSVLSAYDAYTLGRARLARRGDDNLTAALDYFRQAVTEDPGYALAQTSLVEALYLLSFKPWTEHIWIDDRAAASLAAETAKSLDPKLGEVYLAEALIALRDKELGTGEQKSDDEITSLFEKSIGLSPSNAIAYKYYMHHENDIEQELKILKKASSLDPKSGIIKVNIAELYIELGDFDEALRWLRSAAYSVEPYFETAYSEIHNMYLVSTGQLDEAARWGRAWVLAHPEDVYGYLNHLRGLLDLGALDHARELLADVSKLTDPQSENDPFRYVELLMGSQLERATGNSEKASELASRFSREFLQQLPDWPVMADFKPASIALFSMAKADIRGGDYDKALALYTTAYPPGKEVELGNGSNELFRPPIVIAVLRKLLGENDLAVSRLEALLEQVASIPVTGQVDAMGFAEFTILAFLGRADDALQALEAAIDAGYMHKWWTLKDGAFDPEYAKVIADPRFEVLYRQLQDRAGRMKSGFLQQPELPEGWMR